MLVLSRKAGQSIVIGKDVIVRVVRLSGKRAFLAVEAPQSVPVDRSEIRLAKGLGNFAKLRFRKAIRLQTGSGEMRRC